MFLETPDIAGRMPIDRLPEYTAILLATHKYKTETNENMPPIAATQSQTPYSRYSFQCSIFRSGISLTTPLPEP